jgi:hypothetical protein
MKRKGGFLKEEDDMPCCHGNERKQKYKDLVTTVLMYSEPLLKVTFLTK